MIQAGAHRPGTSKKQYSYTDILFDKDGWADSSKFLPISYDLMLLKDEKGLKQIGWYTGQAWDGSRYNGQHITHWKRKMDAES